MSEENAVNPVVEAEAESEEAAQENSNILGRLEEHEMVAINNLRQVEQELDFRIGRLERQKISLCMQAGETSQRIQEIMIEVRKRNNIPLETKLSMNIDGTLTRWEGPAKE